MNMKELPLIPSFNPEGKKQVKVSNGTFIYVERSLTPKEIEQRIERYLNKAAQCERECIKRNGGRKPKQN